LGDLRARRLRSGKVLLTFIAPGNDWNVGRAARYRIQWAVKGSTQRAVTVTIVTAHRQPRPKPAGSHERIALSAPRGTQNVLVSAADAAGTIGTAVTVALK
jgi:hypothetical protein